MEKSEFGLLIKHCFLMGKNTVQAKQWPDKCYPDFSLSRQMLEKWFADFNRGRTNTVDAERSGHPNSAVVPENIKKAHKMVLANQKLKFCEITDTVKISDGSVFTILHKNLSLRKLCSKRVPRLLTVDQKQHRVDDSERCLELFKRGRKDFLRRYVTMDEKWIHHYTLESNRQSAEWTAKGENCPKRPKTQMSAGKVLAFVFWDAHGVLFINNLEERKNYQ